MLHRYVFHTLLVDVDVLATSMQDVLHDSLSQPVSWEARKAKEVSVWQTEFSSLEEGFLCHIPRYIYQQDSYTELRLNTEQPATTNVINKTGRFLSPCQSGDCPCTAPRDYLYPAHGPGFHVSPCSRLSAPAPVMLQQGQASAPLSLSCLATGPAKLDPSTDPHPQPITFPRRVSNAWAGAAQVTLAAVHLAGQWDELWLPCPASPVHVTGIMGSDAGSALQSHSKPASQAGFLNVCARAAHIKSSAWRGMFVWTWWFWVCRFPFSEE